MLCEKRFDFFEHVRAADAMPTTFDLQKRCLHTDLGLAFVKTRRLIERHDRGQARGLWDNRLADFLVRGKGVVRSFRIFEVLGMRRANGDRQCEGAAFSLFTRHGYRAAEQFRDRSRLGLVEAG